MLLIGRQALNKYFDGRPTEDWDILYATESIPSFANDKQHLARLIFDIPEDNRLDMKQIPFDCYNELCKFGDDKCRVNPVGLYTIKLSHSFWDIHWQKTAKDILFFQRNGVKYNKKLFNMLYEYWVTVHGRKRAYLKKKNEEFFSDAVNRQYVHDDIHKAIAYYDAPLYERIKNDKSLALTSKNLFNQLSHEDKIKLCREEIYVTALERFLIPKNFQFPAKIAYINAIRQLVTSMTKGYFPLFIMENFHELESLDKYDWIGKFKLAVQNNQIRAIK